MKLSEKPVLFLDCQTTGMRPTSGHLLELAWAWGQGSIEELGQVQNRLLELPEGAWLPSRISEITGIQESDLENAHPRTQVFQDWQQDLSSGPEPQVLVIHYSQFEEPFLKQLCDEQGHHPNLKILCTSKIAKKLLPHLPSRNIRALAGYFGRPVGELKRAGEHVRGTHEIWKGLVSELEKLGLETWDQVDQWLRETPQVKSTKYEYRIDKNLRLSLPDQPGVYRMLSKSGDVLYVGKATSLKSRVNSYFRGKKGRDARKLEMLTQVWDIRVTPVDTALEAALLENEEIKKWDPPYNVSLKVGRRQFQFYSRDFSETSLQQDAAHPWGPLRRMNSIEQLRSLLRALKTDVFPESLFYVPIPETDLRQGFQLYCAQHGINSAKFLDLRTMMTWGMAQLRLELRKTDLDVDEISEDLSQDAEETEKVTYTIPEISDKFARLFLRAAGEFRRAKRLTGLLNSNVFWREGLDWKTLSLRQGQLSDPNAQALPQVSWPWNGRSLVDVDRMSILLSELSKHDHRIEILRSRNLSPPEPEFPLEPGLPPVSAKD